MQGTIARYTRPYGPRRTASSARGKVVTRCIRRSGEGRVFSGGDPFRNSFKAHRSRRSILAITDDAAFPALAAFAGAGRLPGDRAGAQAGAVPQSGEELLGDAGSAGERALLGLVRGLFRPAGSPA